jgi:hypothetical protein
MKTCQYLESLEQYSNSECTIIFLLNFSLSSLSHATLLHTFKLLAHAGFLHLALRLFLRVFEVASVAQLHKVAGFVHFALETAERRLDRLAIPHFYLDLDAETGCDLMHCKEKRKGISSVRQISDKRN